MPTPPEGRKPRRQGLRPRRGLPLPPRLPRPLGGPAVPARQPRAAASSISPAPSASRASAPRRPRAPGGPAGRRSSSPSSRLGQELRESLRLVQGGRGQARMARPGRGLGARQALPRQRAPSSIWPRPRGRTALLVLDAREGYLVWEALRRCPEGTVAAAAATAGGSRARSPNTPRPCPSWSGPSAALLPLESLVAEALEAAFGFSRFDPRSAGILLPRATGLDRRSLASPGAARRRPHPRLEPPSRGRKALGVFRRRARLRPRRDAAPISRPGSTRGPTCPPSARNRGQLEAALWNRRPRSRDRVEARELSAGASPGPSSSPGSRPPRPTARPSPSASPRPSSRDRLRPRRWPSSLGPRGRPGNSPSSAPSCAFPTP